MFGKINCTKEQPIPDNYSYSPLSYLSNFAFGCTDLITNTCEIFTSACSAVYKKSYETAKKITDTTINVLVTGASASLPVCKTLAIVGIGEVISYTFPHFYEVKLLTAAGAVALSVANPKTDPSHLYQMLFVEKRVWENTPYALSFSLLSAYAFIKMYQTIDQWVYPLGRISLDKETRPIYEWAASCTKASEAWRRAPPFTFEVIGKGSSSWNSLERKITVVRGKPMGEKIDEFLFALSDAIRDDKTIKMWETLDRGELTEDELFKIHDGIYWEAELSTAEIARKCINEVGGRILIISKERPYLELKTDSDIQANKEADSAKANRQYIKEIWEKCGYIPYCTTHPYVESCFTTLEYPKGRFLDIKLHDRAIPICTAQRPLVPNLRFLIQTSRESIKAREKILEEKKFLQTVPELRHLIAFCPEAYEVAQEFTSLGLPEIFLESSGVLGSHKLYNLFSEYLTKTLEAIATHKKVQLVQKPLQGLLFKDDYIDADIRLIWENLIKLAQTSKKCMKLFNKHSTFKFEPQISSPVEGWQDFKKFSQHYLAKNQQKYDTLWQTIGKWRYCLARPSDIECEGKVFQLA